MFKSGPLRAGPLIDIIKDHRDDIAMFKKEAASGLDPDAKAYAIATLPTLEKHLKKLESIAAGAGISAS